MLLEDIVLNYIKFRLEDIKEAKLSFSDSRLWIEVEYGNHVIIEFSYYNLWIHWSIWRSIKEMFSLHYNQIQIIFQKYAEDVIGIYNVTPEEETDPIYVSPIENIIWIT